MEKVTFKKWDPAEYIETPEDVFLTFKVALEENDPEFLLSVIGDIARSKGMAKIAKDLDLDRAGLYRSLSPSGNPSFKTVFNLFDTLGLRMRLEQKSA